MHALAVWSTEDPNTLRRIYTIVVLTDNARRVSIISLDSLFRVALHHFRPFQLRLPRLPWHHLRWTSLTRVHLSTGSLRVQQHCHRLHHTVDWAMEFNLTPVILSMALVKHLKSTCRNYVAVGGAVAQMVTACVAHLVEDAVQMRILSWPGAILATTALENYRLHPSVVSMPLWRHLRSTSTPIRRQEIAAAGVLDHEFPPADVFQFMQSVSLHVQVIVSC